MKPRALAGTLSLVVFAATCIVLLGGAAPHDASELAFDPGGHTRIPFDLSRQHIWVRGTVNGSDSVWIVIDTGASSTVMDEGLARSLKMKLGAKHEARGSGGTQVSHTVENVTVQLPGLSIRKARMAAIDLTSINAQAGRPMQVIVGYDLFASCVVRFDYAGGVMDVWDKDHAPRDSSGTTVPMTLNHNLPYIEGTVVVPGRAPLRGRFVIDTGSSAALILDPEAAQRESLFTAFPRTLMAISRGVGGEVRNRVGRATSFEIGNLAFASPIVMLPDSIGGRISEPGSLGNIGAQVLGRCRVSFDYANRKVRFEKGAGFDKPFEADMSGAALSRSGAEYVVRAVQPDSPASESGLRVGDKVASVDGQPTAAMDSITVRLLLQREGETVTLGVRRGSDSMELRLKLRRLI